MSHVLAPPGSGTKRPITAHDCHEKWTHGTTSRHEAGPMEGREYVFSAGQAKQSVKLSAFLQNLSEQYSS